MQRLRARGEHRKRRSNKEFDAQTDFDPKSVHEGEFVGTTGPNLWFGHGRSRTDPMVSVTPA